MHRVILIALILSISIPISIGHGEHFKNDKSEDSEPDSKIGRYLRRLCSDTKKSKQCWKIIKHEIDRFTDTDIRNVAGIVLNLAIEKSDEINDKLNHLHLDSRDDSLQEKYLSCSNNYNDPHHNLKIAKGYLDSDHDYQRIHDRVDDVAKELKSCKHQFWEKSFDPSHIKDNNKEFGEYVEIVRTATQRFVREKARKS
ncbi:hypothetical protein ACS0TY_018860 [Phlomoides rotata]